MLTDIHQRPLKSLRLSVTDRCNLRCQYCMPEQDYTWLPKKDILDFEEMGVLLSVFAELGVDRLRLTGGEPLIRKDLPALVEILSQQAGIRDLALTTNGIYLPEQGVALQKAGLQRVTVSLDSLRAERFREMTGWDHLAKAKAGIQFAAELGFQSLKLNTVVLRGHNDDELVDLLEFGKQMSAQVRFIEYMDVGGATRWESAKVFKKADILTALQRHYGKLTACAKRDAAPADEWLLPDGTSFGIISSTSEPFCGSCDRSRITADGMWYLCLYARSGVDLRQKLRSGASHQDLLALVSEVWSTRSDRGAEQRLALRQRQPLAAKAELVENPHLEMHKRGG